MDLVFENSGFRAEEKRMSIGMAYPPSKRLQRHIGTLILNYFTDSGSNSPPWEPRYHGSYQLERTKASVQRRQETLNYHYAGKRPGVVLEGKFLMKEFTRSDCYLAEHPSPCET